MLRMSSVAKNRWRLEDTSRALHLVSHCWSQVAMAGGESVTLMEANTSSVRIRLPRWQKWVNKAQRQLKGLTTEQYFPFVDQGTQVAV